MSSNSSSLHWKVAGLAGEGIDVTGIMFGKMCLRHGMNVFSYREYPSLIRGGHNTHQVHASFDPLTSQQKHIDVLVAFTEEGISLHLDELNENSVVLCEASLGKYDTNTYASTGATFYDVPLTIMSREETGHFLAQNVVALGMSAWLLGLDIQTLTQIIADQFHEKSEEVVASNHRAMNRGYSYAKEHFPPLKEPYAKIPKPQLLLSGNQAVALGALSAGVQYFSAYPMTPTSDILSVLASQQKNYPLVVKHAEDEISAINQAIGASYAGVRAMTASATGGYALMVEATSLAAVMETPLVVCVGQRPGPATGLPTWTCQSDLQFILNSGHGECPRVVLTPATVEEHFTSTRLAFYLAEKYHLTVFILSDKFSLESYASMPQPDDEYHNDRFSFAKDPLPEDDSYRRFEVTDEGYSPRSIPGQPHGLSITNSYEHDELGYATESAELTKKMNEKRHRKLISVAKEAPQPILVGYPAAETTLVCWGSTRLVLDDVVRAVPEKYNYIYFPCVSPFPKEEFTKMAHAAQRLIVVEGNINGQLEQVIRQETGIIASDRLRRYDGRPFYAEEVIAELAQK